MATGLRGARALWLNVTAAVGLDAGVRRSERALGSGLCGWASAVGGPFGVGYIWCPGAIRDSGYGDSTTFGAERPAQIPPSGSAWKA